MPLGMDVGLSPGDFVLDGDPVPLPKKGAESPKFSAHVYCFLPYSCEELYACAQIHYLCLAIIEFGLNILWNPVV